MNRSTIDYGIDLGTTNSSIALVSGATTEIIKNSLDADITPSGVYINGKGSLWVGHNAKTKETDERSEEDLFLEFKRRMGTAHQYRFRSSGRTLLPEDLSAEVLKSLRGDVFTRKGEEINAAVITVPAAFELHQCEATKRAGVLAGFSQVALLQEPTAAALAYGYQKLDTKAYWLVFDLGGGTFDAALIRSDEGGLAVANHGGDNFLGGSDIDWAIVEKILAPRVATEYRLSGFERGSVAYRHDLLRLKSAAESAKIDLSLRGTTIVELMLRKVAGDPMYFETRLTREEVARVAEPIIMKAVDIALRVLREKHLSPSAVSKLIFVGGSTLAPYLRDIVATRLGIQADLAVDPMTVVARGAAIFAGTQRLTAPRRGPDATVAKAQAELIYKPVGLDAEPLLGGRIRLPENATPVAHSIEVVNQLTKWRSGRTLLRANGAFQFSLRAESGAQNPFLIELRSPEGLLVPTEPDGFHYTVGAVVEEQPIINHVGVAMADNRVSRHFTKGQGLPAKCTKIYRSASALKRGESSQLLRIPIIEGNRELADRNVLIGTLEITASKISRDLPLGSEIEVTLSMDASRMLTVVAYVPLLDEEFPAKITLGGELRQPVLSVLQAEWRREAARLEELGKRVRRAQNASVLERLQAVENSELVTGLDLRLRGEGGDFDALLKADRDLLELKVLLDQISAKVALPLLIGELENLLNHLGDLAGKNGTPAERERARELRAEATKLIAEADEERLKSKLTETTEAYSLILHRQDAFWGEYFGELCQRLVQTDGQHAVARLVQSGKDHLNAGRIEELKQVVFQLQEALPRKDGEAAWRAYGSNLIS